MRRLLLVYNPRSSHHKQIEGEVLTEVRRLKGWMVGKYAVKKVGLNENAKSLAQVIRDGDLVVAVGGDGTAAMTVNGVMLSKKDVTLGVLGYGNFNDVARMMGVRNEDGVKGIIEAYGADQVREIYTLEVLVNGEFWRFAPCYMTVGLLAEATELMERQEVRAGLNTGTHGPIYSLMVAVKWYLRNKKQCFLPEGMKLNGQILGRGVTDYLAVNGSTLAKIMKGGEWYSSDEKFGSVVEKLGGFWKMVRFGLRSVFFGVRLGESCIDVLEFAQPSAVEIQAEGEYERVEKVLKIEVKKAKRGMKVVMLR